MILSPSQPFLYYHKDFMIKWVRLADDHQARSAHLGLVRLGGLETTSIGETHSTLG